jgi:DNA recombination protein Rad52
MSFTEEQRRELGAKLKRRHVRTRSTSNGVISYVEGWHVIAEANRIFGYGSWDRKTVSPRCVWSENQRGNVAALYTTKVRITVRAGGEVIMREGIGTGFSRAPLAEAAHEMALKAAETDGTKRALATFGNPFGLALYDKDQAGVTRPAGRPSSGIAKLALILWRKGEDDVTFGTPKAFRDAVIAALPTMGTLDDLYEFWKRNRESLEKLSQATRGSDSGSLTETIIAALKARARALGRAPQEKSGEEDQTEGQGQGALAFPKERRIRHKEHLKFVGLQPCLICGRRPSHPHHVRFAQRRALGMKVSDEFTVPLCSVHHDALHRGGDERTWWARRAIDPLEVAAKLWAISMGRQPPQSIGDDGEQGNVGSTSPAPNGLTSEVAKEPANGSDSPTGNLR